jgi:HEPN domain-containing protein
MLHVDQRIVDRIDLEKLRIRKHAFAEVAQSPFARLAALDVLFEHHSWADVVRESQEIVELSLKALLRAHGVDPPRVHDVSEVLLGVRDRLPDAIADDLDELAEISRRLRRDRELAFYGAEDLTPTAFYRPEDAASAREDARRTVDAVGPLIDARR